MYGKKEAPVHLCYSGVSYYILPWSGRIIARFSNGGFTGCRGRGYDATIIISLPTNLVKYL